METTLIDSELLRLVETFSREYMSARSFSGHEFAHVARVDFLCQKLITLEAGTVDGVVLRSAALLHDLGREDERLNPSVDHARRSAEIASEILDKGGFSTFQAEGILHAIVAHRYSGSIAPSTLEAKLLQDADRIDICGAVGIAMTFAYGGAHGRALYNFDDPLADRRALDDEKFSLDHFFNKLLKLPETLHTKSGQYIAGERRKFIEKYIDQFSAEIHGER